jgi:hypothetical protein
MANRASHRPKWKSKCSARRLLVPHRITPHKKQRLSTPNLGDDFMTSLAVLPEQLGATTEPSMATLQASWMPLVSNQELPHDLHLSNQTTVRDLVQFAET